MSYKIVGQDLEVFSGRFNLTKGRESWVEVFSLPKVPTLNHFEALWNLHPKEKGRIKIMGKDIVTPRWQQSFMRPYWFSGMSHAALPLPEIVKPYLKIANKYCKEKFNGREFNGCLLNWYQDGTMYIGPHSDDESELVTDSNGATIVWSLTLQEGEKNRIFRLKPRKGPSKDRLDIEAENGTVIVMGGTCQKTHKHQVPKVSGKNASLYGRRINITFRVFKN